MPEGDRMRTNESRNDLQGGARLVLSIGGMLGLIVGLGAWASRPAHAEIQNDLVGFSTNHVFESGDAGEHIDVMSGNLTLTIPLGPRYKLNDTFGYGLTLYYNSKIWEHECDNIPRNACPGTLPAYDTYGLGFSLVPGRVYHHANDKSYVYRVQLEDGSDHFFCDTRTAAGYPLPPADPNNPPPGYVPPNCDRYTSDTAHIHVAPYTIPNTSVETWKATTPDGRKFIFGHIIDPDTKECLATRIESAELRADGTAAEWVAYSYSSYQLNDITDSHGRGIHFTYNGYPSVIWIDFRSFANLESSMPSTTARYILHTPYRDFDDPSDQAPEPTQKRFLTKIEFPGLNAATESYQFGYERTGWDTFGWLLQRKLPTGATIDYYYEGYRTSNFRPYHIELTSKTLTSGGATYRWSWDRFGVGGRPSLFPPAPNDVPPSESFSGSNPFQVKALDPFDNLTLYNFRYTPYVTGVMPYCNGRDECRNTWSDGLLSDVSTYAGPDPDSTRLVRRVEYEWDSDRNADGTHQMFQYRAASASPTPQNVHSMVVNSRQIEERTFVQGSGGSPGHTVKVTHTDWFRLCSRQTDEYVDDVLYRSTTVDPYGFGHRCDIPSYVQVRDAMGTVVSRVDNKYTSGRLECQVRRKGTVYNNQLPDCTDTSLALQPGDVATINTFDPTTWVTTQTIVRGGDVSASDSRTTTMTYLANATNEKTGYLKTKNYGFAWSAVNRVVDFNTGLTSQTHDPAGNTTRYTWDGLGRLTKIEPTLPEKPTVITYPSLRETHVRQDLVADNYVETAYFYDDLGRLITTKRRNATGTFDVQKTEYDISGRVTRKSEWAADGTAAADFKWTTYDYTIYTDPDAPPGTVANHPDPLGRIHGVTTPDDLTPSTPTTETTYSGNVTTVTVRDVRGWVNGSDTNLTSTTVYTKDALGRLVSVDSPGSGADAQYIYDEADNLTEVRLTDPAAPTQVQVRRFDYDRLGRLRAAVNPENGTVEYTSYDARGNLLSYKDARQNIFKTVYDGADRLLTRSQTVGASDLVLAQNTYDTGVGFDAGGSAGHLVQQDSYKIDGLSSPLVSRVRFSYGAVDSSAACPVAAGGYTGLNGRLSWQTSMIQPWGANLQTDYCHDALGMPTTISYPDFTNSERTRTMIRPTYQNGYLVELHDNGRGLQYLTNVDYAAGGVPKEIDRVNNKDLIELDVRNRPRRFQTIGYNFLPSGSGGGYSVSCEHVHENPHLFPALSIELCDLEGQGGYASGWSESTIWDSGAYAYDMAGNVKTIGAEQYYYDSMSRLVHGSMPGVGMTYALDYEFDAFGNMTSQTRTLSNEPSSQIERTYTIDPLSNRLIEQSVGGSPIGYTFDENGNMTTAGTRGFVFDGQGRLREVMDPAKGRIGNYDYDASGYRVRAEADGVRTYFLRDASGRVLSEFQRPLGGSTLPVWNKDYIYALGKSFALVKNQVPSAPKKPSASDVGNMSLTLNWAPVDEPDILGYNLERRWKKATGHAEIVTNYSLEASDVSWVDNYAMASIDTYLKYTLSAMDTAGNLSGPAPELVVYPWSGHALPNATANVTLTPGDKSMTIRWDPATSTNNDVLGYYVDRGTSLDGPWTQLNSSLLTATVFLDTGLTNGQTYWYRVRTVDTANRESLPSAVKWDTPRDNIPPGKITDVFAEPDRPAQTIIVSWKRGVDLDVASYQVYRSTVAGSPGDRLLPDVSASSQESYSFTDGITPQGFTYYYSVIAVDGSGNPSTASDQVAVRPRHGGVLVPVLQSAEFDVDNKGTTSTHGRLGANRDYGDVTAEDDDVIQVKLEWGPTSDLPFTYRIYRKASDEAHFMLVGTQLYVAGTTSYTYDDTTVTKGDYTYYVTGRKFISPNWEESAAQAVTGTTDHAVSHFNANVSVRNVKGTDSRHAYTTDNKESRYAYIEWSRVTEAELVGYNIYRMCNFQPCNDNPYGSSVMEHFACEPDWIRLNAAPVPPAQRFFEDSSTKGLQGCFLYAVRPVGPDRVEGPIDKIVTVNLSSGQEVFSGNTEKHAIAATYLYPDWPIVDFDYTDNGDYYNPPQVPIATVVNDINSKVRGTGDPSGPPPAPTVVTGRVYRKIAVSPFDPSRFAQIAWTMINEGTSEENAPSDLLGFHIETAGSPNGPWQRLTEHPVAWWERHYTTQGVRLDRCSDSSGHTQCLSYRVIAVDDAGNESPPALASTNPSETTCPMTPDPPKNLRASNYDQQSCSTLLEWDPSPGATEYYVYRFVFYPHHPYFYDTQRVVAPATSYREQGEWDDPARLCTDKYCAYGAYVYCANGYLDAYYVTARGASGGESPRSNLVFWKCGAFGGYSRVVTDDDPINAIAALEEKFPGEVLACWNTDGATPDLLGEATDDRREEAHPTMFATAPMLWLGTEVNPDPPWIVMDLHTDHLGSVRAVTTNPGLNTTRHDYFPFGDEILSQFSYNTHQYTGHERDQETGLDYMLARYYQAGMGRFLSVDPLQSAGRNLRRPQRWNRYAYTLNNPMRYADPNGEAEVEVSLRAFVPKDTVGVFKGDNRGFSADRSASSRTAVTTKVETDPAKRPGPSAQIAKTQSTIGESRSTIPGVAPRTATGPESPKAIGHSDAKGNTAINFHQDVKIPFPVPTGGIKADLTVTVNPGATSATITGTISGSPSFEMNFSVDGGPTQNVELQEASDNDLEFGANLQTTTTVNKTVELKKP